MVTPTVVRYGGYSHIDDLAIELEQRAKAVLWEMHFHYRHNRGYDTTYAEAYTMLRQAKVLHEAEHRGDREAGTFLEKDRHVNLMETADQEAGTAPEREGRVGVSHRQELEFATGGKCHAGAALVHVDHRPAHGTALA